MNSASEDDNTAMALDLPAGTTISHYEIVSKIGSGGMGDVYLARDNQLDRHVAIKFLPGHLVGNRDSRLRFKREAQAVARLNHPNVVTIHEVGEHNGRPYFVMEHIEGSSLHYFAHEKPLSIAEIVDLAIQVTDGLQAAHTSGIVHRDIKSANIMVDREGRARLVDFGLAVLNDGDNLTKTGTTIGTIAYMSPEQVEGKATDHRSDLFSLGVVIYELLASGTPFKRENQAATFKAILLDEPPPLNEKLKNFPESLQKVVSRVLEKDPGKRYQSALELRDALRAVRNRIDGTEGATRTNASIAVLPFEDMSPQKDQEYFCDGIAEEIINALASIDDLDVAARTSAFSFKGKEMDVPEIGRRLHVDTVLEGSVRKAGNRVRITAQLINVADGFHLWSDKYDRDLEDIFAIQDEMATVITDKLKVTLSLSEESAMTRHGTSNLKAYDAFLRGRFYWEQRGRRLDTALGFFKLAAELDPDYAMAYVGMGDAYHMMGLYGIMPPKESMPLAKQAAQRALELEPNLAAAHTTLAMVSLLFDRDWETARQLFERAIELNPNHVQSHYWYAYWYVYLYQYDVGAALKASQRGIDIDPLAALPLIHYCLILWMEDRFDEVLTIMERIEHQDPIAYRSYWWLIGCCYSGKGDHEKALSVCPPVEKSLTRHEWSVAYHGFILAKAEKSNEAELLYEELKRRSRDSYVSNYSRAIIPMALGREEEALDILEGATESRDCAIILTSRWPMFAPLRKNERFIKLLRKEGLKPYS